MMIKLLGKYIGPMLYWKLDKRLIASQMLDGSASSVASVALTMSRHRALVIEYNCTSV